MVMQLLRFGGVGALATGLHVLVALVATVAGLSPLGANLAGFTAALSASYLGHARVTFGIAPRFGQEAGRFAVTALLGLCASTLTVWLLAERAGLGMGVAMGAVAVIVPTATYLGLRFWVFTGDRARARIDWAGLMVAGAVTVAVTRFFWGRMINHDTAWYLLATRDWLAGAALYTDISEVNPPLNFYLTLPALGMADLLGVSDTNGQYLLLGLMLFASLAWSGAILRGGLALSPARHALMVAGLGAAMVLPALGSFGQREQILVMLAMPWAVGQLGGAGGRGTIPRAMCAAVGVCLKPHFLLLPVAVVLWRIAVTRTLRPVLSAETLTFVAVGAAYVGYVAVVHPAYLTDIVPMAREVYGAYGAPLGMVFSEIWFRLAVLSAVVVVARLSVGAGRGATPLWALSAAGVAAYLLQGTGFGYHTIPFLAFGMAGCVVTILAAPRIGAGVVAAALALALLADDAIRRGPYRNVLAEQIANVATESGGITSLVVLTTNVYAGPPAAIAAGADWASSYSANWLVPGAVNRLDRADCGATPDFCDRLRGIAARNRSDNLDDIATRVPDLLVIDRRPGHFDRPGFDWLAFMRGDPRWAAVFAAYEYQRTQDRFAFYRRVGEGGE